MNSEVTLLPCPFCNSAAMVRKKGKRVWWIPGHEDKVSCSNDGCGAHFSYWSQAEWNRQLTTPPASGEVVGVAMAVSDASVEAMVKTLRDFAGAYPEDVFIPLTPEETKKYGTIITQASAGMGRHMGKFMLKAAEMIEQLSAAPKQAMGSFVLEDDENAYITEEGSVCIDWCDDPKRQLTLLVQKSGAIRYAMYLDGEKLNGDAMSPEFIRDIYRWSHPAPLDLAPSELPSPPEKAGG